LEHSIPDTMILVGEYIFMSFLYSIGAFLTTNVVGENVLIMP
jgi:hypothetical protein